VAVRGIVDGIAAIDSPVTQQAQDFNPATFLAMQQYFELLKIPLVETTV
jgi:hypothetical protein